MGKLGIVVVLLLHAATAADLQNAMMGTWVGTLEYRDYAEPATSTKRVKLPTWLHVDPAGADLRFLYVYDDGPTKTVRETSLVRIDAGAGVYTVLDSEGKVENTYTIAGLEQLQAGRGTLTLTGKGTENDKPVDVRMTLRIGRNILEMMRETAVSGQPFSFRHAYTFVRAEPVAPAK
jgi:hypothetical protein